MTECNEHKVEHKVSPHKRVSSSKYNRAIRLMQNKLSIIYITFKKKIAHAEIFIAKFNLTKIEEK